MTTEPIECPHNVDGYCQISTQLADMPVPIARDACAACILQSNPRTKNSVTCSKAIQYRTIVGMLPTEELLDCVKPPAKGVGTELEILIERTRTFLQRLRLDWLLPPPVNCGCSTTKALMNTQGALVCLNSRREHAREILHRWTNHLPAIRFIPFVRFLIERYIVRAAHNLQAKEKTHG
jgi:hypothetical protein